MCEIIIDPLLLRDGVESARKTAGSGKFMAPTGISYTKCAFRGNFSEARRQLIRVRLQVHVDTQEFTRTTFANARTERGSYAAAVAAS